MINRMSDIEVKFPQDSDLQPKVQLDFELMLNSETVCKEMKKLSFKQNKAPAPPTFIAEECASDPSSDSSIVLAWTQPKLSSAKNHVQGYVLEVDDGSAESLFKEVYYGTDTICQINGLSVNSVYNARVKAFNQAGFSEYSSIISVSASPSRLSFDFEILSFLGLGFLTFTTW